MNFEEFKNLLFEKAKQEGFEEYEIYCVKGENLSVSVYEGEVEKYNVDKSFAVSFRGKINNKMGYSYTEIIDDDAINLLIKNAKDSAKYMENEEFIYEGDKSYENVKTFSKDLENIDAKDLIDVALNLEKITREYSDKVVNTNGCKISLTTSQTQIINSKGVNLIKKDNLLLGYVVAIIKDNDKKIDGMGYFLANSLLDIDVKKVASDAVEDALSKINSHSIKSNNYKMIINNEAMATLLSTFSDCFSADTAQKGLSLLKDKEGKMVASNIVTIIDDPLLDFGIASTSFDDEGVATYKKEVIKNGKLTTLLHNLKTANKAKTKSTANGFKASYSSCVLVSVTNFYIQNGNNSLEDLMLKLNEGVMITDFSGLHSGANPITGDFSLAAKGFYIKNGKKYFPIEQITVAGNFFTLLKNIESIANDLKFPLSSIGSPSILVKELSIAGK